MKTAGHSEVAAAPKNTETGTSTPSNAANQQDPTTWFAKTVMGMDGMEDTLKLKAQNIAKGLGMDMNKLLKELWKEKVQHLLRVQPKLLLLVLLLHTNVASPLAQLLRIRSHSLLPSMASRPS